VSKPEKARFWPRLTNGEFFYHNPLGELIQNQRG
jgi:hypothetical protein